MQKYASKKIFSGEPYLVYSPALIQEGISAELAYEIDIVGNFADDLISLSRTYQGYQTSLYAGSRKGYFVCVDLLPSNGTPRSIYATKEMRENLFSYDPRERLWYKMGEKATRPVYTDPYKTTEGVMGITCTMPYYDNDGFAGVVGIGCNIADVYRQVADGVIGETGFNVVMNAEGKIIFSTDIEYISSELGKNDLRQSYDSDIAQAARRMVAGEKDVLLIILDNKEYYLAFAPMKEVGWSFGVLLENLVITIADVSGKEVPAALFMAISKTILKNFALSMKTPDDLASVMTLANQQLCHDNDEMLFVTVFMGMLDLKTGEFIYVNGGHNAPLICRENHCDFLDVGKSCMLGIDEDVPFTQKKITLAKGDFFLYTDGVTEAMNDKRELFGEERLREFFSRQNKSEPLETLLFQSTHPDGARQPALETLLNNLQKEIKIHAGDVEQSDDITMLALVYRGFLIDC